ncbi:MAG: hypothetical protein JNM72_12215 [Deltaproteobacteria bacterium]|nr:hypothetical protein [Deltaproteobacteria bacterium]
MHEQPTADRTGSANHNLSDFAARTADDLSPEAAAAYAELLREAYQGPFHWGEGDGVHHRSAWLLLSPSGAIVGAGLSQAEAAKAVGLDLDLPTGFAFARLAVVGDLRALHAVTDPLFSGWRVCLGPALAAALRGVERRLRAQDRERLSLELAAQPQSDPAAEPDTEELPFDTAVRA